MLPMAGCSGRRGIQSFLETTVIACLSFWHEAQMNAPKHTITSKASHHRFNFASALSAG
jgi:hypothetical protein